MHSQGIRNGLYTCVHSLTAGFIQQPNSSEQQAETVREEAGAEAVAR